MEYLEDLLTDDQHQSCDADVNVHIDFCGIPCLRTMRQRAAVLTSVVTFCPSHALMNDIYRNISTCYDLLHHRKSVDEEVQAALQSRTYRNIRNLATLRRLTTESDHFNFYIPGFHSSKEATVKSWAVDFVGSAADALWETLNGYTDSNMETYPRFLSVVQSSGTGKSRLVDELSKNHLVVPIVLRTEETGFPPPDRAVRNWLLNEKFEDAAVDPFHAFLWALFVTLKRYLSQIDERVAPLVQDLPNEQRPTSLSGKFPWFMTAGQTFSSHGQDRIQFYDEILSLASLKLYVDIDHSLYGRLAEEEDLKSVIEPLMSVLVKDFKPQTSYPAQVILAFDEAHVLTDARNGPQWIGRIFDDPWTKFSDLRRVLECINRFPCFSLFLSTTASTYKPSSSQIQGDLRLIPPFCEMGLDHLARPVSGNGGTTLEKVATVDFMASLGRPLFSSRYHCGDRDIQFWTIHFAQQKLICCSPDVREFTYDAKLACMCVRFALEFSGATEASRERERTQVQKHLRVYLSPNTGETPAVTVAPSEPLLAEAASYLMIRPNFNVPDSLLHELNSSVFHKDTRGELIITSIVTEARDRATTSRRIFFHLPRFFKELLATEPAARLMESFPAKIRHSVESQRFGDLFSDSWMHFNHFIRIQDLRVINREYLWRLMIRGAAVLCPRDRGSIDMVLPFCFRGTQISRANTSGILVTVRNDPIFQSAPDPFLFDVMDPYSVGLFDEVETDHVPVIRIVFALASDNAGVTIIDPPERTPPDSAGAIPTDNYTAYDIWCAKASQGTFAAVTDDYTYEKLLKCSRSLPLKEQNKGLGIDARPGHWLRYALHDANSPETGDGACMALDRTMQ